MAGEKRQITRLYLDELGVYAIGTDIIMALKPDGRLVRTGLTAGGMSAGVALESDNINDADPNVNKFVSALDLAKLGFIVVTEPIDLDFRQQQLIDLDFDFALQLTTGLDF